MISRRMSWDFFGFSERRFAQAEAQIRWPSPLRVRTVVVERKRFSISSAIRRLKARHKTGGRATFWISSRVEVLPVPARALMRRLSLVLVTRSRICRCSSVGARESLSIKHHLISGFGINYFPPVPTSAVCFDFLLGFFDGVNSAEEDIPTTTRVECNAPEN